ncbi:MAG: BON domain-containing protein [Steroidobacteraceae bacterium]
MSKLMRRFTCFLPLVLISLMGCASTRTHESPGEYVEDSALTMKVKTAIFAEESLKSSEINVETFKGVVQLSGFVNSQADINRAVSVAQNVSGVTSVKNDMQLKKANP